MSAVVIRVAANFFGRRVATNITPCPGHLSVESVATRRMASPQTAKAACTTRADDTHTNDFGGGCRPTDGSASSAHHDDVQASEGYDVPLRLLVARRPLHREHA